MKGGGFWEGDTFLEGPSEQGLECQEGSWCTP